jgi:hypothetical protein
MSSKKTQVKKLSPEEIKKRRDFMDKKDKRFINKISSVRRECNNKEQNKKFMEWVNKHIDDLNDVYENCNVEMSFEDFTKIAYECTEKCSC